MNASSIIASLQAQVDLIAVAAISNNNLMIVEYKEDEGLYQVTYADVLNGDAVVDAYMFAANCETAKDAVQYLKSKVSGELIYLKPQIIL